MKIEQDISEFQHNVGETFECTLKATGKSFSVLSSGLYSNKSQAVVRELVNNAIDSHIAAGTSELVEVHAPTSIEPWFSVKDTGLGMDHETVKRVLTVYFESTKTNTNELVGGFGLGSKTPFCYSDQFTMISIFDGIKTHYSAAISDTGFPTIIVIASEKTTEHNGITVSVPIKQSDIQDFNYSIRKIVPHLSRPVECNIIIDPLPEPKIKNNNWAIYNKAICGLDNVIHLNQGGYLYPISYQQLLDIEYITNKNYYDYQFLFRLPIIVNVPIGTIEPSASRETISFTQKTTKNVKSILDQFISDLKKWCSAFIDQAPSAWDAKRLLQQVETTFPYDLRTMFPNTWNNIYIGTDYKLDHDIRITKIVGVNSKVKQIRHYGKLAKYHLSSDNLFVIVDLKSGITNAKKAFEELHVGNVVNYIYGDLLVISDYLKSIGSPPSVYHLSKYAQATVKEKVAIGRSLDLKTGISTPIYKFDSDKPFIIDVFSTKICDYNTHTTSTLVNKLTTLVANGVFENTNLQIINYTYKTKHKVNIGKWIGEQSAKFLAVPENYNRMVSFINAAENNQLLNMLTLSITPNTHKDIVDFCQYFDKMYNDEVCAIIKTLSYKLVTVNTHVSNEFTTRLNALKTQYPFINLINNYNTADIVRTLSTLIGA